MEPADGSQIADKPLSAVWPFVHRGYVSISLGGGVDESSGPLFELWYGVAKSSRREFNKKRLEVFLAGPVHRLPFEDVDAELAGAIRADLGSIGKPIGAYDPLIAGQAMRNKLTLITANLSEFARIKALACADWGKP